MAKTKLNDIKGFFSPGAWAEMDTYEKQSLCSAKRNYEAMLAAGLEPRKPYFMMSPVEQKNLTAGKPKNHEPKPPKATARAPSGPVRKSRRLQQSVGAVIHVDDDDDIVLCDECHKQWAGDCPIHGPLLVVDNSEVSESEDRVRGTLPPALVVRKSEVAVEDEGSDSDQDADNVPVPAEGSDAAKQDRVVLGVWTKEAVPRRTRFGPYEGDVPKGPRGRGSVGADANWLQLVQEDRERRANLRPFEYRGRLYFRTVRDVPVHAELVVCYPAKQRWRHVGEQVFPGAAGAAGAAVDVGCGHFDRWVPADLLLAQHLRASATCAAKIAEQRRLRALAAAEAASKYCTSTHRDGDREQRELEREQRELLWDQASRQREEMCRRRVERLRHQYASAFRDITHASNIVQPGGDDADGDLKCPVCGQEFRRSCRLRDHMDSHIGGEQGAGGSFDCSACKASFSRGDQLRQHVLLTHVGLKRYSCGLCGASFNRQSALDNHALSCRP